MTRKVDQSLWKFRSDITLLEQLPKNLQKVTYEVTTEHMEPPLYIGDTIGPIYVSCMQLFKDELRRIGEILVGGGGALATEEVADLVPPTDSLADSHRKLDTI